MQSLGRGGEPNEALPSESNSNHNIDPILIEKLHQKSNYLNHLESRHHNLAEQLKSCTQHYRRVVVPEDKMPNEHQKNSLGGELRKLELKAVRLKHQLEHASQEELSPREPIASETEPYSTSTDEAERDFPHTINMTTDHQVEIYGQSLMQMATDQRSDQIEKIEETHFFTVKPDNPTKLWQSMTTRLLVETCQGKTAPLVAVADSGAAWCAIHLTWIHNHAPDLISRISEVRKRFLDASNNEMPLAGTLDITFWLGEARLTTKCYVFKNLSADFLLGTNAIVENGLVIDGQSRMIYQKATGANAPLRVDASEDQPTLELICDRDNCCVWAKTPTEPTCANINALKVECERHTDNGTSPAEGKPKSRPRKKTLKLRNVDRVNLKPQETKAVLLILTDLPNPNPGEIETEVDPTFANKYADRIHTADCMKISTMNKHAFVMMRNSSNKDITLARGLVVLKEAEEEATPEKILNVRPAADAGETARHTQEPSVFENLGLSIAMCEYTEASRWKCVGTNRPTNGLWYEPQPTLRHLLEKAQQPDGADLTLPEEG